MTPRRRLTILTILLIGYGVIVIAVAGLGWFTTRSLHQLQTMTEALYVHPFAVSNAAVSLKGSLFQLRNQMVQIVLVKDRHENLEAMEQDAGDYEQQIHADVAVINANFLGDMNRVREFEARFAQWNRVRAEILTANRAGQSEAAEQLIKTDGTAKFNELLPLVDYVQSFAKDKAQSFVEQAERASQHMMTQVFNVIALLVTLVLATAAVVVWRVHFLQRELDRQATTDVLTGIANRRAFMEFVSREIERAKRYKAPFALAVVDLDWFKNVNDTNGHQTGDTVLKNFCTVCQQTVRATDTLGRIGGEEFAILFPNTALPEAKEVLERVRVAVEQAEMAMSPGAPVRITASFGLTAFVSPRSELDLLFKQADEALYQAKDRGRNRVCTLAS